MEWMDLPVLVYHISDVSWLIFAHIVLCGLQIYGEFDSEAFCIESIYHYEQLKFNSPQW